MQRARATITYGSGAPGVMTLYTSTAGPENSASAQLCIDRLKDALTAALPIINSSTTFTSDTFVDTIDPATGLITGSDSITPWTLVGSSGTSYLPKASMLCTTWKTDDIVAGRRVRGRTFLGPLSVFAIEADGSPSATALGYQNDFASAWLDAGATAVYACVWKRPKGATAGSDHVITSYSYKDKFAVLRSRRD